MQTQKQQPQLEASLEECTNLQRSRTRQYSYDGTAYSSSGSRRHQRYSQQEQALSTSFQTHVSAEHLSISPETQLRFLHQATSFLAIQAAESRQRSETLVSKGSENIDTERDREARVQRWKEERRFERIQDEVRRLEAVIANEGTDIQETRFEKNLVKFLQTSTCRVRPRPRSSSTYNLELDPCRRMTLADVSPMRTRSWSVTAAFMESLRIRQPKHRKPLVSSLQSTPEDSPFSKPRHPPVFSSMSTPTELYSGTAIIFSNDETQFNPDVQNIIVEMPDYAKDLFSGFDSVALALELELDERPLESSLISTKNPSPFSQSPPSSTNHSRYSSVPASPSPSPSHPRSRPASSPSSLRIRDRFSAPKLRARSSLRSLHPNNTKAARNSLLSIPESSKFSSRSSFTSSLVGIRKPSTEITVPTPTTMAMPNPIGDSSSPSPNSKPSSLRRRISARFSNSLSSVFVSPTRKSTLREV